MQLVAHNAFMAQKNPTISVQISLTQSAKTHMDRLSDETEIPVKRVLSKVYEWFASLPPTAQKAVLWPAKSVDEVDATRVAIEYLMRLRGELSRSAEAPPPEELGVAGREIVRRQAARRAGKNVDPPPHPGKSQAG